MSDLLMSYTHLVEKFNSKLNLVSRADLNIYYDRHISEGIESFRIFMDIYGNSNEYSGYDLGSGNGVPGLVWCILNPKLKLSLVEIDLRKSEFLKHCIRELGLTNCNVLNTSVADLRLNPTDFFVCRAFRNIDKLFQEFPALVSYHGFLLKGSTWNNEVPIDLNLSLTPTPYTTKSGLPRTFIHFKPNN